jgi:hypothetical protein
LRDRLLAFPDLFEQVFSAAKEGLQLLIVVFAIASPNIAVDRTATKDPLNSGAKSHTFTPWIPETCSALAALKFAAAAFEWYGDRRHRQSRSDVLTGRMPVRAMTPEPAHDRANENECSHARTNAAERLALRLRPLYLCLAAVAMNPATHPSNFVMAFLCTVIQKGRGVLRVQSACDLRRTPFDRA